MTGLQPGVDRLGPYALVRLLGSGAMGTVYLAEDAGRRVAVKVIHPHLMTQPDSIERFYREAEAGARVDHPNVVRTLDRDILVTDRTIRCYLVMEYVEGRTLREMLGEWGSAPEALVREIARQTAAGLCGIHDAGMVHRDLKPENVLITSDHQVRIMDLGVARLIDRTSALTQDGPFAGSMPYASPEQFRGAPLGPASDLYSLGILLFELVTGETPFRCEDVPAWIHAHLDVDPPRADDFRPEVSVFFSEVVHTLLAKRPASRFPSARDLGRVLDEGESSAWWGGRQRTLLERAPEAPRVPVRRRTKLYGRGTEMALLDRCWKAARAGRGNAVLLDGEAGIGKSRLVDEFLRQVNAADAHLMYGSYSPSGGLGAVSDAIVGKFGSRALSEALTPYLTTTPALIPAFAAVVQCEVRPGLEPITDDTLQAVLVQLMRGLAGERPLLWVVEDLHFAEPSARRRVLSLARGLEGHRVLLVLTSRPGLPEEESAHYDRLSSFKRCPLSRLGAREVVLLLQDAFRSDALADRLGARIALKSDGIPFFVFEMIRDLRDKEFIAELPSGTWVEAKEIDEIEVPSAIKDLVGARVSDLTKAERAILDVGAVQGFEFDPHLTADVLERPRVAVLQDLAEMERRFGVVRAIGRHYRFDHHQIQEVVYAQLPLRLREEYHAALAEAIGRHADADDKEVTQLDGAVCAVLCEHHLKGGRGRAALRFLDAAFEHLAACYLQDEAAALAERALAVPALIQGALRVDLLLRWAGRVHLLGRTEEERRVLDEAVALAADLGEPVLRARAGADLGRHLRRTAQYDEAGAVLQRALEDAREAGDRTIEMRAVGRLGSVCYAQGRLDEARERYEHQRDLARASGDRLEEAHAVGNLGTVLSDQSRYAEAQACFEHHLAVARRVEDLRGESVARGNLGILLSTQGRYEEARGHLERQLAIAQEMGDRQGEAKATGSLGFIAGMQSRFAEALAHHERHLAITREIGDRRSEGIATANLGNVFVNLGRYEEARTCLEDGLEITREIGNRSGEARANGQLGFICLVQGRNDEAQEHLERWLVMARELGDRAGEGYALGYLGDIAHGAGRFEEARIRYERRLAISHSIGDRRGESIAHAGLGSVHLALGRTALAASHYERRLVLARAINDRQSEGASQGSLGSVLAAEGRYAEARVRYERCLEIAREIGDRRGEACALGFLGQAHAAGGRATDARRCFERRLAISIEIGDPKSEAEARLELGRRLAIDGRLGEARRLLESAVSSGRETASPEVIVLAACELAALPGGDAEAALGDLTALEGCLGHAIRLEAHFLLWRATGDAAHLAAAKRILDELLDRAPSEHREGLRDRVPPYREVLRAWEARDG